MNKVVVSTESLTAVADKIREKSNSSEGLEFPNGYINAIDNIKPTKPYIDSSKIKNLEKFFAIEPTTVYINPISLVENLDTSSVENFYCAFWNRTDLLEVELDTSSAKICTFMFKGCNNLKTVGELDLSNAEDVREMFQSNYALERVGNLNTVNCTNFQNMFYECIKLQEIGSINLSNATNYSSAFSDCPVLKEIRFEGIVPIFNDSFYLAYTPRISPESLASLVNALHNTDGQTHTINLGAENIAKLTEEQLEVIASKNLNVQ